MRKYVAPTMVEIPGWLEPHNPFDGRYMGAPCCEPPYNHHSQCTCSLYEGEGAKKLQGEAYYLIRALNA